MKTTSNKPVAAVCDRRQSLPFRGLRRSQAAATWLGFVFFAFFCGQSFCSAQVQQAWVAKYNNGILNGTNQAVKMALDSAGNIYVTGFSQNATNGNLDYATIKYAPNGNQVWATRFVATNTTTAKPAGMVLDYKTNVIVTGSSVTVKYDTNGNQLWTAPYAGSTSGNPIAIDMSNDVFVTAFSTDFGLEKLSPSGTNIWEATFPSPYGQALGQSICVDSSGHAFVAGLYQIANGQFYDYEMLAAKYDTNGNQLWNGSVELPPFYGPSYIQTTALDGSGNLYVLWNNPANAPYETAKFAGSNGSKVWNASDPTGNGNSSSRGMVIDSLSNVWVTGVKYSAYYTYTNTQYGTYQINTNGAYVASPVYPSYPSGFPAGKILSAANAIAVDAGNNIYVTGYSPGTNTGNDIVTIKYDGNGNQIWLQRYNGPGNGDDEGNAIAVDALGNVYVTGYETTAAGGTEMVTIKYAPAALLQKQGNGSILLQEQGEPGEAFDFQASTNLQTWLDLGTTNADTNGFVQFLDTNAPNFSRRFYLSLPQ